MKKTACMFVIAMCCLATGGCNAMFKCMILCMDSRPNWREFEKDGVNLTGRITYSGKTEQVRYHTLWMKRAKDGSWQTPLVVELADKQYVALENITPEFLAANAVLGRKLEHDPINLDGYSLAGVRFIVRDGQQVSALRVDWSSVRWDARGKMVPNESKTILWDAQMRKRYEFPLSQEDVVELFGEPEKQVDRFLF